MPMALGHEAVATVLEPGAIAAQHFGAGDRVVLSFNFCGECPSCQRHAPSYCHYFFGQNFLGQRRDGSTALSRQGQPVRHNFFGQSSFASLAIANQRNVLKLDDDADLATLAPLGCGIQTGVGGVLDKSGGYVAPAGGASKPGLPEIPQLLSARTLWLFE